MLGLFGGADSISASIVVGAFLLGLGVGSLAATLFVDRLSPRRALLWFAACEVGIAIFAAASPTLFYDVLFIRLAVIVHARPLLFAIIAASLLWPTILMGLSLPLLARAITGEIGEAAARIGRLYGVNTVG